MDRAIWVDELNPHTHNDSVQAPQEPERDLNLFTHEWGVYFRKLELKFERQKAAKIKRRKANKTARQSRRKHG